MRRITRSLITTTLLLFWFLVHSTPAAQFDEDLIEVAGLGDAIRVEDLLRKGANVNARDEEGQTPLMKASSEGHEKVVVHLINAGAHLQLTDKEGKTALIGACEGGYEQVAKLLVEKGANVNIRDKSGRDALMYASKRGAVGLVSQLIQWGSNPNVIGGNGDTALIIACKQGNRDLVKILLGRSTGVPAEGVHGFELIKACMIGDAERVRDLVAKGADVNATTRNGNCSAAFIASAMGYDDVLDLLLDKGALLTKKSEPKQVPQALIYAAKNGHCKVVEKLMVDKMDLNSRDQDGDTALTLAAEKGHQSVIELLVNKGANVNTPNSSGDTPVILASENGHIEALRYLLSKKANPDVKNKKGMTALMWASKQGNIDSVQLLLGQGADTDSADDKGKTSCILAVSNNRPEILELLLKKGAKPDKSTKDDGLSALIVAAKNNRVEEARLLLKHGASANLKDRKGASPLHYAASQDYSEMVKLLLESKAILDQRDSDGWTPLIAACSNGHEEIATLLIDAGADINARTKKGVSALMLSAYHGESGIVEKLWERGCDVNAVDNKGRSAVFYCAAGNRIYLAKLLLEKGALPDIRDKEGITPLMVATSEGKADFVKLLLKHGADPNLKLKRAGNAFEIAERLKQRQVLDILTSYAAYGLASLEGPAEKGGYLGIEFRSLSPANATALGMSSIDGVQVVRIMPHSPAKKAGLMEKDIIAKCNDITIRGSADFIPLIKNFSPGQTVTLTVFREGRIITLTAQISDAPGATPEEPFMAKEKPATTFASAIKKFNAQPGDDFVERPPTEKPDDDTYYFLQGTIETREGDVVICKSKKTSYAASPDIVSGKWGFKTGRFKGYIPRVNEEVKMIGKISEVIKGKLVIGAPIHVVVFEAEFVENDRHSYQP